MAEVVSRKSKDPSTRTGAVVTLGNRVISTGFNGFPQRIKDDERLNYRPTKYRIIIHCEINAIFFAHRDLTGCTLYTYPFSSCDRCAAHVVQAGFSRVVAPVNTEPRWEEQLNFGLDLFREAGIVIALYNIWDQ